ncbi:MAG TPA: immunoglobulin-like domain-containing protein [Thermomicrobiales bacterium]|nr:immunoglobulin-like domain-containing protein [Thermomicrobiales bacterium]
MRSIRVGTDKRGYRPGETLFARVENLGTEPVRYRKPFAIDKLVNGAWIRVGPGDEIWLRDVARLGAGQAGECMAYRIPRGFGPGNYRVAKEVETVGSGGWVDLLRYGDFNIGG